MDATAGDNGLERADFAEEPGDRERVGDDLQALVHEQARHGVGGGAAVEEDRHTGLHLLGHREGDGVLFLGHALVAGDEIEFLFHVVRLDEGSTAVVAAQHALGLEFVERAPHGRKRDRKLGGERVEVGILVLADVLLDEVEALLVGHGAGAGTSLENNSR